MSSFESTSCIVALKTRILEIDSEIKRLEAQKETCLQELAEVILDQSKVSHQIDLDPHEVYVGSC